MSVVTQTIDAQPYSILGAKLPDSHVDQVDETNESFVLSPSRQFIFEDRPIPGLRTSRDVRVRVIATGLCGSDVSNSLFLCTLSTDHILHTDTLLATWSHRQLCREEPDSPRPRKRWHRRSMWRRCQDPPSRRPSRTRAWCRLQHVRDVPKWTIQPLPLD